MSGRNNGGGGGCREESYRVSCSMCFLSCQGGTTGGGVVGKNHNGRGVVGKNHICLCFLSCQGGTTGGGGCREE